MTKTHLNRQTWRALTPERGQMTEVYAPRVESRRQNNVKGEEGWKVLFGEKEKKKRGHGSGKGRKTDTDWQMTMDKRISLLRRMEIFLGIFVDVNMILLFLLLSEKIKAWLGEETKDSVKIFLGEVQRRVRIHLKHIFYTNNDTHLRMGKNIKWQIMYPNNTGSKWGDTRANDILPSWEHDTYPEEFEWLSYKRLEKGRSGTHGCVVHIFLFVQQK